jgi:di/tricarboxylate transporter
MTLDQFLLFALLASILGLLLSGRLRYDFVAFGGLLLAVLLGLVPEEEAFSGFSSPAVIIVALVLIASKAFENSGALSWFVRRIGAEVRSVGVHITLTSGIGAALSAVINNVAALALLMPIDIAAARKAGRPPAITLMPLAFATILGGMITLIGTPPNIIASSIRAERLGQPYAIFDFAPVGLAVAIVGLAFIALVGWRLVPKREDKTAMLLNDASFKAEIVVPETASLIGRFVADLEEEAEAADVILLGLLRGKQRVYATMRPIPVAPGDRLIIEGSTDGIAAFMKATGLEDRVDPSDVEPKVTDDGEEPSKPERESPQIVEAVVPFDSSLPGHSARSLDMRRRFGATLIGIARGDILSNRQIRDRAVEAGDVLLLAGRRVALSTTINQFNLIPISRVDIARPRTFQIALVVGLFVAALIAAGTGLLSFATGLAIAVAGYAAFGVVSARELYEQIDWSVIVMLACLLPIGSAFDSTGGTALIASGIAAINFGGSALTALIIVMVATMMLSDVLNNVATIVIMGPVGITLAETLGANPDAFLMSTAVAASCSFLTPIGHKNNTLIMGPASLRFGDYWRLGICLELIVLVVSIPILLVVWPL